MTQLFRGTQNEKLSPSQIVFTLQRARVIHQGWPSAS